MTARPQIDPVAGPDAGSAEPQGAPAAARAYLGGLIRYDSERRRVWIGRQRLHHGTTGMALAATGLAGLAARRISPKGTLELALVGAALMADDWHDRSVWLQRGPQD